MDTGRRIIGKGCAWTDCGHMNSINTVVIEHMDRDIWNDYCYTDTLLHDRY